MSKWNPQVGFEKRFKSISGVTVCLMASYQAQQNALSPSPQPSVGNKILCPTSGFSHFNHIIMSRLQSAHHPVAFSGFVPVLGLFVSVKEY
jgi:hypothetical protein